MKKIFKWVGIVVVVIIVLAVIGNMGKSGSNSATNSNNGTVTQTTSAKNEEVPQEVMKITATEIADDFDSNQVAAEAKWEGKLIQFSAKVSNINDMGIAFHSVASKQFSLTQISCKVTDKQQLLSLKNGQNVTVKGVVGKQSIGVIEVNNCQVVQ